jgi:hypothetical protein
MAVRDGWIIYAAFGVLVCLLLWRVATEWRVKSIEAENLRASLIILGVVVLAGVVWQGVRQTSFSRQDHHRICRSVDDKCARRR